jgi:beta-glucosidase
LSTALRSVAVLGPLAEGSDSVEGRVAVLHGVAAGVSVLEGIRAKLPNATVVSAPGPAIRRDILPFYLETMPHLFPGHMPEAQSPEDADTAFDYAIEIAQAAEIVVMALGESDDMAGEYASRSSLELPGRQEELLRTVVALGKPVVLVLLNGRPLSIPWAAENVPAIVEAWRPGREGGHAIADVLFGDVNPGGKLPVSFPRRAAHLPQYYARTNTHLPESAPSYRSRYWDGPSAPLFPFGFGLSYTTFSFDGPRLGARRVAVGEVLGVEVDVTNTGAIAGDEVVQLYVHQRFGSDSRPVRELKGFERITLQPGGTKTVAFTLGPDELSYWSTSQAKWIQEPAEFDIWVGSDSQASLHAEFEVVA